MNEHEEIELTVGNKKFRVRGADLVAILQLIVVCVMAFGLFRHDADAANADKEIVSAIVAQTKVLKEQLDAQREANCLNRLTPEQRNQPKEIEFCQALGKGR